MFVEYFKVEFYTLYSKLNCRLEEIGVAAAKEYSLEKALSKMKSEWKDVYLDMVPYRETVSKLDLYSYIYLLISS